jgi:hypothetical protein
MTLSTVHLHSRDLSPAAREALDNALCLYLGGYFAAAREIAQTMLQAGPWHITAAGPTLERLEILLPLACWADGLGSPAVGEEPARDAHTLSIHAHECCDDALSMMVMCDRAQTHDAGAGWSLDRLVTLPARALDAPHERAQFIGDLELVLKQRAREVLSVAQTDLLPEFLKEILPAGFDAPIRVAPETAELPHGLLASILGKLEPRHHGVPDIVEQRCWLLIAALDLQQGDSAAASRHLAEAIAHGVEPASFFILLYWRPLHELLATHCLALALGLTDERVNAYLRQFRSRKSSVAAPPPAAPFDWASALRSYEEQHATACSPEIDWIEPGCAALARVKSTGRICNHPARAEEIARLEDRLRLTLPRSYAAFLRHADGMLLPDGVIDLLPAAEVDWLAARHGDWIGAWATLDSGPEVDDERYFTYGCDQESIWFRSRYLETALQVSDVNNGEVILLNPQVRFGDEWEAWYFAHDLPGAARYRSFAGLMRSRIFDRVLETADIED